MSRAIRNIKRAFFYIPKVTFGFFPITSAIITRVITSVVDKFRVLSAWIFTQTLP